jgi:hypothetical protein
LLERSSQNSCWTEGCWSGEAHSRVPTSHASGRQVEDIDEIKPTMEATCDSSI